MMRIQIKILGGFIVEDMLQETIRKLNVMNGRKVGSDRLLAELSRK
jgi:hypothetical protein